MATAIPRAPAPAVPGTRALPAHLATAPVPLAGRSTARPDTLGHLSQALVPGLTVALVPDGEAAAPWEWPGSRGKTQCAAQAAVHLQQSGAVDLVAWVDASGRASLLDGLAAAGLRAGLDGEGGAERTAARFVAWLRGTTRRSLVVLDDVRDPGDVAGWWPAGPAVTTLVTARDPAVVAGPAARVVPVGCYSQREAIAALSAWLSTDPDQRSGHLDLVLALDCEPTAIAHAGAVIATAELTCLSYHELFLKRRTVIEQAVGREVPAPAVTWILSAEHAEILEPGAGTWPLLVLAALLSPRGMPAAVLTSASACHALALPADRAQAAVAALHQAGLLAIDHNGPVPVATMTAPLQAAVRASAPPDLVERAADAAADALAASWPDSDPQSPAARLYRSSATTLRAAAGLLLAGGRHHRMLAAAGHSHQAAGLAGPAAAWWHGLARDSARLLSADHDDTLAAGSQAASTLLAAGQADDALGWADWVMTRRAAALGPDHRATITAATVAGRALGAAGRSADALAILADAAGRAMRVLGPQDETALAARYELADAFLAAGRPAQAARVLRHAVTALKESPGQDDAATWPATERLATACLAAGQAGQAIEALGEVLSGRERLLGPDHPDTLQARVLLASAHRAAGDSTAALQHCQQAHAGYQRTLGAAHRTTLACAADLARAYAACGQATAAMSLLAQSITAAGRALPPGDPLTGELLQTRTDLFT